METIYALYHGDPDEPKVFYVGRTARDPMIRLAEHRQKIRKGTEDVYCFIRDHLQPCGIDVWDMRVLSQDADEEWEDFWIVQMIRNGHDLKNMKHGDLKKIAKLKELAQGEDFVDLVGFRKVKQRVEQEAYARSEELKRAVLGETPNPRMDVAAFVQASTARFREENAVKFERERKKAAAAQARARERDEWIRSQSKLFK